MPIAVFLWVLGLLLFFGLPNYYRQTPGKVPSFYKSVSRRKIILWNFVVVILQNFFLSAPYGRNWSCKCLQTHQDFLRIANTIQSSGAPSTPKIGRLVSWLLLSSASLG